MALEMIFSPFLGLLFDKLSSLIGREFRLLHGLNKDLEKLSKVLSTINTVLADAEVKQINDKSTGDWLAKLKDAAYDAEDALDECEFEALKQESEMDDVNCAKQVSDCLSACFNFKQIVFCRKMGKRIKELSERFDEIDAQRFKFQLSPGVAVSEGEGFIRGRETSSLLTEPIVCGRTRETEKIIEMLLNNASSSYDLSICPILGIGGLGKTTLAQLVYGDERVVNQFGTRIWVCVSEDFSVKRITKMIIDHLLEKRCDLEDLDPMQNRLKKLLSGKKYLLVLDDVWDDDRENWNKVIHVLGCGGTGSSIIVTTRLQTVVTSMTSLPNTRNSSLRVINPTFNLEYLLECDSWSLFKYYAFGAGDGENQNLQEIGKKILIKCGGLPLAIKAVGSLLNSRNEEFWILVRDSELWSLKEHGENVILPALRLSYKHLPSVSKQCFAYCSVYPKDWNLDKESLIHEWMANGFIQPTKGKELEDIGNEIFSGFLQRSLFQEIHTRSGWYTMHDLVHDLACSIMKNECSRMKSSEMKDFHQRLRHLSVTWGSQYSAATRIALFHPFLHTLIFFVLVGSKSSKLDLFLSCSSGLKHLRVLDLGGLWSMKSIPSWIGHLKLLKYLSLENTGIALLPMFVCGLSNLQVLLLASNPKLTSLPSSIEKLKNLRYLDLSHSSIKELPESICSLTNLQTLKLWVCKKLDMLPRGMKNMKNLRHLVFIWHISSKFLVNSMPAGIGELTRLETLDVFVCCNASEGGARIRELGRLNQLIGSLKIKEIRHVSDPMDAQHANLKSKIKLSKLWLLWGDDDYANEEEKNKRSKQVLESLEPHSNIQSLSICDYPGVELPAWVGNCAVTLPNLCELAFTKMPNAVHHLLQLPPNLKKLQIAACPNMWLHSRLRLPSSIDLLSVAASNDPTLRSVEALPHLSDLHIADFHQQETLLGAPLQNPKFVNHQLLQTEKASYRT